MLPEATIIAHPQIAIAGRQNEFVEAIGCKLKSPQFVKCHRADENRRRPVRISWRLLWVRYGSCAQSYKRRTNSLHRWSERPGFVVLRNPNLASVCVTTMPSSEDFQACPQRTAKAFGHLPLLPEAFHDGFDTLLRVAAVRLYLPASSRKVLYPRLSPSINLTNALCASRSSPLHDHDACTTIENEVHPNGRQLSIPEVGTPPAASHRTQATHFATGLRLLGVPQNRTAVVRHLSRPILDRFA